MPSLQTLAQWPGLDKLVVLAVNFKQAVPGLQNFMQKTALQLLALPGLQGALAQQWGTKVFPSPVMIGSDGGARGVVQGKLAWASSDAARLLQPLF